MSVDEMLSFVDLWCSSFTWFIGALSLTFGEIFKGFGLIAPPAIANYSLFSVMFAGLSVYVGISVIKWIIGIIT